MAFYCQTIKYVIHYYNSVQTLMNCYASEALQEYYRIMEQKNSKTQVEQENKNFSGRKLSALLLDY